MDDHKGILLESGTNELEILIFGIGGGLFGINVMKVREIIAPVKATKIPNAHPFVMGIIQLRDEVLPVVDLGKAFNYAPSNDPAEHKLIVAELNKLKAAFYVHSVSRIHRVSWEKVEKPSEFYHGFQGAITGIVKIDDQMILLLDFEKVIVDISPQSGIHSGRIKNLGPRERSEKRILIAEDSAILRKLIRDTLEETGYVNLEFFDNGLLAWEYLEELARTEGDKLTEHVKLVVTDIEMPQMDGLHLTKRIKEHSLLKDLPVVIFSSLISDDLRHKGKKVGADAQITKPEIEQLVQVIDELILK